MALIEKDRRLCKYRKSPPDPSIFRRYTHTYTQNIVIDVLEKN